MQGGQGMRRGRMETYFASPERATPGELYRDIHEASNNPIFDGLLATVGGLVAILNEHRQILTVNDALLKMVGIDDAHAVLGLRPGEAIGCVHAHEMPGGCGTSQYCPTCGAAIAIVTAISANTTQEQRCIATVHKDGFDLDLCLRVRACPLSIDGKRFILLFMQDITLQERWASLERTFFHDINNLITGLQGASELMEFSNEEGKLRLTKQMQLLSQRLAKEVEIQRVLSHSGQHRYEVELQEFTADDIIREMQVIFAGHCAAKNKVLSLPENAPGIKIHSDRHLVLRVLTNMLINACEATPDGGTIKLWVVHDRHVTFHVWNKHAIPDEVAIRIFQRHFSTKGNHGRGIGTYGMKLFGEEFLKGRVDFVTSETEGTTFSFALPLQS